MKSESRRSKYWISLMPMMFFLLGSELDGKIIHLPSRSIIGMHAFAPDMRVPHKVHSIVE